MTDEMRTWELGEKPGECVVNLGASGRLVGIQCGGPHNGVVIGTERLVRLASALLEAAGLAGVPQEPFGGDFLSAKADMAAVRAVLSAAASDDRSVRMGANVVRALATVLESGKGPDLAAFEKGSRAAALLGDMDRCEHGRHSTDSCFSCPGGKSSGNQICPPGTLIGHNYAGQEIRVPEPDQRYEPLNWRH